MAFSFALLLLSLLNFAAMDPEVSTALDETESLGNEWWQAGQAAMAHGRTDEAIVYYQRSLALDPDFAQNHLSLAAALLEKGDEAAACPHLAHYVAARPEHLIVRSYFAELLVRLRRLREARREFLRFDADTQSIDTATTPQLVHCHRRLMEIAEMDQDDYGEHLHRGIGLYLLACQRAKLDDNSGDLPVEGLLCQAATEFAKARDSRPEEARPCWYLYETWSRLGQRHPATKWLKDAEAAAPFAFLTQAERRGLQMASQAYDCGKRR